MDWKQILRAPSAPAAEQESRLTVEQTVDEANTDLFVKLNLGKLAAYSVGIEAPFAVAAVATRAPEMLALGGFLALTLACDAVYDAHNYYRNDVLPKKPFNIFIKPKANELQS
jgi:hypothetical protein